MPAYPAIPNPNQSLASRTVVPVLRTDMESGLVRQVSRFSTGRKTYNASWTFTQAQYELFKTFFHTDLEGGTLYFTLNVPTSTGFEDLSLRFADGTYADRYKAHAYWEVTAVLEEEILQEVPSTADTPTPIWFQPTREIFIDTEIDQRFANNMLVFAPNSGEQITLTVPGISSPSDWLPFGVMNKGPGNVVITVGEAVVPPDPSDTWEALANTLNAFGIYRFDTGVTTSGGGVIGVQDLSPNSHDLEDYHPTTANRATIVAGWLHCAAASDKSWMGTPKRSNPADVLTEGFALNYEEFHILAVVRFPVIAEMSSFILQTYKVTSSVTGYTSIGSSGGTTWTYTHNGTAGSVTVPYHYPTTGISPRLIELCQVHEDTHAAMYVDGLPVAVNGSPSRPLTMVHFGGRYTKSGFTSTMEVAAFVIFSNSTNMQDPELQESIARLRKMMLDDFS